MNPRAVIADALAGCVPWGTAPECWLRDADEVLAALKAAASGGPVVLRWDTTPCPDCLELGCDSCGGSGVVTAVTMWGLEPRGELLYAEGTFFGVDKAEPLYRIIALNEEA